MSAATSQQPDPATKPGEASGTVFGVILRRAALLLLYAVVLYACRWLAYMIRFDFSIPTEYLPQIRARGIWFIPTQLAFLAFFGQFSGILRYFGLRELRRLAYALGFATATLYFARLFAVPGDQPPRGVILLGGLLSFLVIGGLRSGWRMAASWKENRSHEGTYTPRRVGIIGAGDAGADLIKQFKDRPRFGLKPVALFDDDRSKWHSEVFGVPVIGSPDDLPSQAKRLKLEEVIIAMPGTPARRLREVAQKAQQAELKAVTVPSLGQLALGHVRVSHLRPLKFEDVLGRDPVNIELDQIQPLIADRVVMVTGAGGSIGSELCRQIAKLNPKTLLLVEQSEGNLFQIEQELVKLGHGAIINPIVADIVDMDRMRRVMATQKPVVLFHAAAHKHVPMMERQPGEAIKNNALGTAGLANLALEFGVERFVLISTDKAVNPTSVMGATKRLAEDYLQSLAAANPGRTRFIAVRFGNVLGSSGSVVPIFSQQIADGGPVTVTDPAMTRYFMTIPEAVGLVLQSFSLGHGGEIFVLEMGSPVKILDMAKTMIRLHGYEPERDIDIVITGLRPGEKLFEELIHDGATHAKTAHPRILQLRSEARSLVEVQSALAEFQEKVRNSSGAELKELLRRHLRDYKPFAPTNGSSAPKTTAQGKNGDGKA